MTEKELENRKKYLEKLLIKINKDLSDVPEGRLRVIAGRKSPQYYLITEKYDTIGRYLRKDERKIAEILAQKTYNDKMIAQISAELKAINNLLKCGFNDSHLGEIYAEMNGPRRAIVKPHVLSDEEFVADWLAEEYQGKGFAEDDPEHYTNREERVRSKSEETIANIFFEMGIPYKYEHPVKIDGSFYAYVDFTFLIMPQRKVCYLEHFGMMDDPTYLKESFFSKMNSYTKNGLVPGVNFFMTFESKANPLIARDVKKYIEQIVRSIREGV